METIHNPSDLELLVINDMYELGFNPNDPADVNKYWEMLLS
jgi:hypothetical protein